MRNYEKDGRNSTEYYKNSLALSNKELAKQWHPIKNGKISPYDVSVYSQKKVWWIYPYDDPITGRHFDFEWEASPNSRIKGKGKCPFLLGQRIWKGFNDLETIKPELAKQWHPTKNGYLKPTDVTLNSNKKVWWIYPYDDPKTGKHFDFEWEAKVSDRARGNGCPFLKGGKVRVWKGFNDLETLRPELANQWHPTKNGSKKPDEYTEFAADKVWWIYPYDDPKTGKHFDFEWEATIRSRSRGRNCPFLSNEAVWRGYNDLETINPLLAKEWSPHNKKKPYEYGAVSGKKVLWICTNGHEYESSIAHRKNRGCPYCSGQKPIIGQNDFATIHKELLIEWNYEKNRRNPESYTHSSGEKVWWKCRKGHEWKTRIGNRVNLGNGCPECAKQNM